MAKIEKKSIEEGCSSSDYMLNAGRALSEKVQKYINDKRLKKQVTLLIGKGNNGGDAYVVGCDLLKKGFDVKAFYLFDSKECSDLNRQHHDHFVQSGGGAFFFEKGADFTPFEKGVIVDGLLGTGFSGETQGTLKELIDKANTSQLPMISIDIPSGLDGNTGEVKGSCIKADVTIYLGLAKLGFFINDGYSVIGKIEPVDFGMDIKYYGVMQNEAYLFQEQKVFELLPKISRTCHKYERGYVVALAGSQGMTGAAKLCTLAALRSGAGIVRLFCSEGMQLELSSSFPELIKSLWSRDDLFNLFEEEKRAKALLIGPGLGKSEDVRYVIKELLKQSKTPLIIDADAVEIFAKDIEVYPENIILTPHRAEFLRSIDEDKSINDLQLIEKAETFVKDKKVVLILKGAPTWVFHPGYKPVVFPYGDPGMATAGSGDVLSGIVAAFLAQGLEPFHSACLSVYIHAKAGELAVKDKTSYGLIASDIIDTIPKVIKAIQETQLSFFESN